VKVCRLIIKNFRGIDTATILLPNHAVLIGDNNTGKTTILEALDLVLGPDRLNRQPPIDEHDFYQGKYITAPRPPEAGDGNQPAPAAAVADPAGGAAANSPAADESANRIDIEVTIADLSEEQKARFGDYTEFWDTATNSFYTDANPPGVDRASITEAVRVSFHGWYDPEQDDFEGKTYFTRSLSETDNPDFFQKKDKQICGFLYLRSLRTGAP
jgi:putative ATP-dependent endonuclease of the OLD family